MAKVTFRSKSTEEVAIFVGHNGWRVVQPGETMQVDDDDVVTPGLTEVVDGKEQLVLGDDGKPVRPPTSSADSYRVQPDLWEEVTSTPPPQPSAPPAPPAPAEPTQEA